MKKVVLSEPKHLEICESDVPVRKEGFARIKMECCGICGSDLTAYLGTNLTVRYPVNGIGHEGIGRITEIGSNDRGLAVGDLVAMEPYIPCLKCHMCQAGRYNNCADLHVAGVHTDGVMAEEIVFPTHLLYKVPDGLDPCAAALTEPLTIGLHGAARSGLAAGEYCLITGAGPIGLLAALGAKAKGAVPILADVVSERLAFAEDCGIPYTFNNKNGDLIAFLNEVTGGSLPSVMLDTTGAPPILGNMHDYVRHGGRISLIGWPKGPVTINTVRCMQKELDLYPVRNSNRQFPTALKLIADGAIPTEKIITKVIAMDEVRDTIEDMIANPGNYMKVVVRIGA